MQQDQAVDCMSPIQDTSLKCRSEHQCRHSTRLLDISDLLDCAWSASMVPFPPRAPPHLLPRLLPRFRGAAPRSRWEVNVLARRTERERERESRPSVYLSRPKESRPSCFFGVWGVRKTSPHRTEMHRDEKAEWSTGDTGLGHGSSCKKCKVCLCKVAK